MENKENINSNDSLENLSADDFVIVPKEEKIKDVKFDSKATTFAKDAFKRFCKNKSSVVAAFIIGILTLLAIFVPIVSPYESSANTSHPSETLLRPKMFDATSSWWNGTDKFKDEVVKMDENGLFETATGEKFSFYNNKFNRPSSILNLSDITTKYTNTCFEYGHNGYYLANTGELLNDSNATKEFYVQTNDKANFKKADNVVIDFKFGITDENGVVLDEYKNINGDQLGAYRFFFREEGEKPAYYFYYDTNTSAWVASKRADLTDEFWSTSYVDREINVNDILTLINKSSLNNFQFGVEVKATADVRSYVMFKTIEFKCDESATDSTKEKFGYMSMLDANQKAFLTKIDENGKKNLGYYGATCVKQVYQAEYKVVSFDFDGYDAVYGITNKIIGKSEMDGYISKGYCTFDYNTKEFTVLNEKLCPVVKVDDVYVSTVAGNEIVQINAEISQYRYLGYSKMPKYWFGTDNTGLDLFTKCFRGLRTSLILSCITAAVCFIFGLCWGAISGYFGGSVDLFMERFCDILGGVPWIVVMTLAILHLGNSFGTFVLALCLTGWMGTSARTRTQFYRFKGREYVLASRTLGASDMRLIFKHILPNALGTIITGAVLMIPGCIFSEATLSYLQLGLQGKVSFGTILSKNQAFLGDHPALILFPAAIISLIMISFNLFGNGLRDAVNPSLKGSE